MTERKGTFGQIFLYRNLYWERTIWTCIWSTLTLLRESILQDHLVNDFSAGDTLPSKESIFFRVKLFIDHPTTTFTAFHKSLPIPKDIALIEMINNYFFQNWVDLNLS